MPKGEKNRPVEKIEFRLRSRRLARLLTLGAMRSEVLDYAMKQYGVSERSARRLYEAARDELRAEWDVDRPDLVAQMLATSSLIIKDSISAKQHQTALAAMQFQARLTKLDR